MSNYTQFELFFIICINASIQYIVNLIKTMEFNLRKWKNIKFET